MLHEKQIKAVEMIATGDFTMEEIALECGCDRTTLYNWLKKPDVVAELDKALQDIKTRVSKEFTSKLPTAIQEYWKICTQTKDVRTKEKALDTWISRSLGRIASNVNITDERQDDDVDILAFLDDAPKNEGAK